MADTLPRTDRIPTLLIAPDAGPMWSAALQAFGARAPQADFRLAGGFADAADYIGDAVAVMSFVLTDELAAKARSLQWIHSLGAGVDGLVNLPSLRPGVILTSMGAMNSPVVAEHVVAAMFAHFRHLPDAVRSQDRRVWAPVTARLLAGMTVGIVGTGNVGTELARRCTGLGMKPIGFSATAGPRAGYDAVYPRDELVTRAETCDVIALTTALKPETRHIADGRLFAAMQPSALLINVGRGGLLDERALLAALEAGRPAAAALDVFDTEPLPADSPLWNHPRVMVTAHSAGRYDGYIRDAAAIVGTNFERFAAGDVEHMLNVVRPASAPA